MSVPAVPTPDLPPPDPRTRFRNTRRQGALVAVLVVLLGWLTGFGVQGLFFVGPGTVLFCVILGSVLTIFERTRPFAVGFLIASAIILVVTAGACAALIAIALRTA